MTVTSETRSRPSLDLLRNLTDAHVLDQLFDGAELTRADLAARTGISKPTISESVRRLEGAGLLATSGQQTGKRGPSASFYRLRADAATAVAMAIGPEGVRARLLDLRGHLVAEAGRPVTSPTTAAELTPLVLETVSALLGGADRSVVAVTLSAANPVDRTTGRLIRLPYSPFLIDELDPVPLLTGSLPVTPEVDNDVNWAALAEHRVGAAQDLDDFVYCYLGPGLGAGLVCGGEIVRGHRGLAGELAHVLTVGRDGRARRLVDCFADWGLLQDGSTAIDLERLRSVLSDDTRTARLSRSAVVAALAGAIATISTLLNPAGVVIGGPWSDLPGFVEEIAEQVRATAMVPTDVRTAVLGAQAPLIGAGSEAVRRARQALTG